MAKDVLVLGAGVSGLSSAIFLQQAGYYVTIWAEYFTPNTTSDVAAAFWYPYLCAPEDKATIWCKFTLEYVRNNLLDDNTSGCRNQAVTTMFAHKVGEPWWAGAVEYEHVQASELPAGYIDGYKLTTVLMDSSRYMPWLMRKFAAAGGKAVERKVEQVEEAFADFNIVVNCTGLGSAELLGDKELFPVRGQVLKVTGQNLSEVIADDEDGGPNFLSYIIPRFDDIVLGGTAQANDANTEISPGDSLEILRKTAALLPALADVKMLSEKVGLRPARSAVRLEKEAYVPGKWLIHNYGHGGAGYTLSWGCAADVVKLVESIE